MLGVKWIQCGIPQKHNTMNVTAKRGKNFNCLISLPAEICVLFPSQSELPQPFMAGERVYSIVAFSPWIVEGAKVASDILEGLGLVVGVDGMSAMIVDGLKFAAAGDVGETTGAVGLLNGEVVCRTVGGLVGTGEMVGAMVGGGG
jgi:hypothetical protein